MTIDLSNRTLGALAVAALAATVLIAANEPANKTNVAAAESEVAFVVDQPTELLHETLRVSKPQDLILAVTAECSILSEITTVGNDTASTNGQLRLYITIDGQHVPVSDADKDAGRVVFCDREYQRTTSLFDDPDATIEDYLATRSANAFNWVVLGAGHWDADGDGLLDVTVWAEYDETNVGEESDSTGVIGNRTLIIQPTHAKNSETLGSD
ncbi:MAG TPA: hypothetical protein VGA69_11665 [Nitriliruptorales bacterium]